MSYYQTEKTFWAKAQIGSKDECWDWKRRKDKKGYGLARYMSLTGTDSSIAAHRISYALTKNGGVLPPRGIDVHHKCENKACINPNHLVLMSHGAHTSMHHDGIGRGCKTHQHSFWDYKNRECKVCRSEYRREKYGWSARIPGCRKHGLQDWRESTNHCRICERIRGVEKRARAKERAELSG